MAILRVSDIKDCVGIVTKFCKIKSNLRKDKIDLLLTKVHKVNTKEN
jgi:hypothetical protein